MASNPNPSRITAASWWLMEQLLALEPGTRNGGIYANKPGYHNTRAANSASNYSVRDAVDREGPSDKAAAYDWTFTDAQAGRYSTIEKYTDRLLASAKDLNDPRLNGWREFYGQADSDTAVEGWDTRYGYAATSDPSHLWHLHFSESRGLVEDYANKRALLSVLRGETVAEWRAAENGDDMSEFMSIDDFPNPKWRHDAATNSTVKRGFAFGSMWDGIHRTEEGVSAIRTDQRAAAVQLAAILTAVAGEDIGKAVRDELAAAAERERAERAAERAQLVSDLAPVLVAALHDAVGGGLPDGVISSAVADALRNVLGSLDEPDAGVQA